MEQKEKEDIKEMHGDYGWSLRDLSKEYGISIRDVKEIIGEKNLEGRETDEEPEHRSGHRTQEHLSLSERRGRVKSQREAREAKEDRLAKTKTINDFRENGCALARCPRCGEIMTDVAVTETGYHYWCTECDYVDERDKVCDNSCCRRGLVVLLAKEGVKLDETTAQNFIDKG